MSTDWDEVVEKSSTARTPEHKINYYVVDAIRAYLWGRDSLLKAKYRGGPHPLSGHCYVASEAYWHLTHKTLLPHTLTIGTGVHWFLRGSLDSIDWPIVDITGDQFESQGIVVPYNQGVRRGFLTNQVSSRARTVIDAVRRLEFEFSELQDETVYAEHPDGSKDKYDQDIFKDLIKKYHPSSITDVSKWSVGYDLAASAISANTITVTGGGASSGYIISAT